MVTQHLARIESLAHLPRAELASLARHVKVLCLPTDRWLVREGRVLDQFLYLLLGKVHTFAPKRCLRASSVGTLKHFYPGVLNVKTASSCQVLFLEARLRAFALQHSSSNLVITTESEQWLATFLHSELMQHLDVAMVAQVLRRLRQRTIEAGGEVVRLGEAADCCFVVERGEAVILLEGKEIRTLKPGDFFGEDALIRGGTRSATVTACSPLTLRVLHVRDFKSHLLDRLVLPVCNSTGGVQLNVTTLGWQAPGIDIRAQIGALDKGVQYSVRGVDKNFVALVVFLMLQAGIKAFAA